MAKCPYSDIFGAPGTGVHRWRIPILDIALVDTLMTILLAFGNFKTFNFKSFWIVMLWTFIGVRSSTGSPARRRGS